MIVIVIMFVVAVFVMSEIPDSEKEKVQIDDQRREATAGQSLLFVIAVVVVAVVGFRLLLLLPLS